MLIESFRVRLDLETPNFELEDFRLLHSITPDLRLLINIFLQVHKENSFKSSSKLVVMSQRVKVQIIDRTGIRAVARGRMVQV